MAYVSAEDTKLIRKELKTRFPKFKFSVKNDRHTSVRVVIKSGPTNFGVTGDGATLNQYHTYRYENKEILEEIIEVINTAGTFKNFNKSDITTDYFHVGYYVDISLGTWNKPFVLTAA